MASDKRNTEEVTKRPFADWLREQGKGATHDELTEALHQLTTAVQDTGRGGQLVLVVKVTPMKKNTDVMEVTDDVRVKLPQIERKASIFFADGDGNLTRQDPNQLSFEGIREVPAPADAAATTPKENRA